jgi:hypothetical protein
VPLAVFDAESDTLLVNSNVNTAIVLRGFIFMGEVCGWSFVKKYNPRSRDLQSYPLRAPKKLAWFCLRTKKNISSENERMVRLG